MRWYWRLRRHPVGFWVLTVVLAALSAGAVLEASARAHAAVARWGRLAPVVVMSRPVELGSVVEADDVRVESVPRRLVPAGPAVRGVDEAVGRVALAPLWPGEVLLRGRLAPEGLRGVAALVPEGMRAVAVPVLADGALRVAVGDVVDVLATFEVADAAGAAEGPQAPTDPTVVVAEAAAVVDVADGAVTVAVPADVAPRLAYAATRATLTLALSPPPRVAFSTGTGPVEKGEVGR